MKCRLSAKDILKGYEIMKSIMKKVIAVFAVLCVAMTSVVSCSDKPSDSGSSSSSSSSGGNDTTLSDEEKQALMQMPLNIGEPGDGVAIAGDGDVDLDADDPVAVTTAKADAKTTTASKAVVTAVQEVTNADNTPVTQIVQVTDADGAVQTDADSQVVTEAAVVTEVVTIPADENPDTPDTPDDTTQAPENSDYKPKNDGRYAMWIDVSKDENFFFEGDMLKVTFKVKEDIPDGDYKIRIAPDLADVAGVSVKPSKVMDGTIRVNNGEIEAADVSGETGALVFYGDNIACKQGDTIDFNINIKNNTGLVGFCIWFYFDGNALDFVDACATGEYEEIARQTEIGRGNKVDDQ